ncbi:tail fiber protein [Bradyrhizobium sp. 192]|uniref:phage tail protein n=1 Tax=Bradyrhizobium sp. 192 TaxID=2782660 RepID=UPI001FFFA862|nr:tail fiber protein [Bradyrhizobium sp. 192]UPJ56002.1 tail fiber protein [Bradyrhizobium sp. 192]
MTFYKWSQDPATNATADSSINYQEGQAPSSLNDSARAAMAALAKFRDDVMGAIATSGTSTAYTLSSYQTFNSLANLSGKVVAFTPHTTNGGTVTLNVDGLGAKALRSAPNVELPAGVLVAGSPYVALYNNSDSAFYLHGFYNSPALVPVGTILPYAGSSAPNSNFALCYGQAVSRSTYATLYGLTSTNYGSGDGTTTFNIPDLRGRVAAGKDDMGGSAASRLTGSFITSPTTLGSAGGSESRQLATANLPPYTPAGSISNGSISISHNAIAGTSTTGGGGFTCGGPSGASISASQGTSTFAGTAQGGTTNAFGIIQPTLILSYIIRIL